MQVKADPQKGDVLAVKNKDGSTSYYKYDPGDKGANEQGYAGSGTESTLDAVTVTANPGKKGNLAGVSTQTSSNDENIACGDRSDNGNSADN